MIMYFAGEGNIRFKGLTTNRLVSYLSFRNNPLKAKQYCENNQPINIFLDSGAYSAMTMGKPINIDEYLQFCLQTKQYFKVIANLDVIGNAEQTYKNWLYLRSKGLNPLPVFHYNSDILYLQKYIKEHKQTYIALGGLVPHAMEKDNLRKWLDYCFVNLKQDWPIKTHLFGIASPWALERYPVYSCDSTSWLAASNYGRILKFNKNKIVGLDLKLQQYYRKKHYTFTQGQCANEYLKLEQYITKLWERRGVTWTVTN